MLKSIWKYIDSLLPDKRRKKKPTEGADLNKLLKMISQRHFEPVIIFSFSKKEVEGYAMAMSKFDFNKDEEKEDIVQIFNQAMSCLSEEDRNLSQVTEMLGILKKGIGIHHGGLLPIVKEVTELLFQEGYIKVLFSTETFSMGLNMPARTVVFTDLRKFDGEQHRWIRGGEYIQMSGRAGRRGKDEKGFTILMLDEKMEPEVAKSMLKGQSDPLYSSFHLSYNMLLNAIRTEGNDPEYIIYRSFHQFQNEKAVPEMVKKLEQLRKEKEGIHPEHQSVVAEVYKIDQHIKLYQEKIKQIMVMPQHVLPFLKIGRIIHLKNNDIDWGWGVTINFTKKRMQVKKKQKKSDNPGK
mgnify:FL=1